MCKIIAHSCVRATQTVLELEQALCVVMSATGRQFVSITDAHKQLISALTDLKSWRDKAKEIKELLYRMLQNRASMQELAAKHNVRSAAHTPASASLQSMYQ